MAQLIQSSGIYKDVDLSFTSNGETISVRRGKQPNLTVKKIMTDCR